jgi:hypothetical protein
MTSPSAPEGERRQDVVTGAPARGGHRRPLRRAFVIGFVITVPAVFVGLLVPAAEKIIPFVTPGTLLLRPLTPWINLWPGAVNMLLASTVNGLVFGVLASCIALLQSRVRRPGVES